MLPASLTITPPATKIRKKHIRLQSNDIAVREHSTPAYQHYTASFFFIPIVMVDKQHYVSTYWIRL